METEEQLLKAVKSGDRQAMRRLYERYKGYAMSIGLRYIPDSDDVEDVVQDSFVKILTSVQHIDYQGEGSLTAWVRKTVVNQFYGYHPGYTRRGTRVGTDSTSYPQQNDCTVACRL